MQGYLKPLARGHHQRELTRTYMCGLCHLLGEHYGFIYRLFATPDVVFLNVFLDAVDGRPAPFVNKSCPLLPVLSNAPVRAQTDNARFAAAFGLYMGVEKLRDNLADEGGLHRYLAWKLFERGYRQAREELLHQGFPVSDVERWMKVNAKLEKRPVLSLQRAAQPSAGIAALMLGHAGRHATAAAQTALRAVGRALGAYLFFMDSVLDYGQDGRSGSYNPLLRLGPGEPANAGHVLDLGTQHAQRQVEQLSAALSNVPMQDPHGFIRSTLVDGLRDKIRRYRLLNQTQRLTASLALVEPPPGSMLLAVLRHTLNGATARAKLLLALMMTWLAPRSPTLARMATALVVTVLPHLAWADGGPDGSVDGGDAGGDAGDAAVDAGRVDGGRDGGNLRDAGSGFGGTTSSSGGGGGGGQVDCCPDCANGICTAPCGWCCAAYEGCGCGNILAQCPCIYCCLVCK